jgi:hypothetical protein
LRAAVLALILAELAAGRARAEPVEVPALTGDARAHWQRGLAEHAARHYQAASAEFAACYRLAQRRECLFAWAQAARLAGDCETARELYRRYLQGELSPRQAEAARSQLAACEAQIAARAGGRAEPTSEPPAEPRTSAAEPGADARSAPAQPGIDPRRALVQTGASSARPVADRSPPTDAPVRPPWYRDRWGDVLAGGGVVAVAVGAAIYASARRDAAASAPTYDAYTEHFRGAETARRWALAAIGAGAALVASGVIHMALREGPGPAAAAAARIDVVVDGTQLALRCAGAF